MKHKELCSWFNGNECDCNAELVNDLLEALELVTTDIETYTPDWDENKVGGLATVMLEIYTIRQIEAAIQKGKA